MDTLTALLNVQVLLFSLFLVIVSFGVRRLVEAIFPTLSKVTPMSVAERVWEEFALPFLPVFLGALLARTMTVFPLPAVATASVGARYVFGVVDGWFASAIYDGVSFFVKKKWNIDIPVVQMELVPGDHKQV